MGGTFIERMELLKTMTRCREGHIVGKVTISQLYAQYQHEGLDFKHPRGGQAKYLQTPLMTHHARFLRRYADHLLKDGGIPAMIENMEDLSAAAARLTPREFGDLAASGHPQVLVGRFFPEVVYDRPPAVPRLTEQQLKAKGRSRTWLNRALGRERWRGSWSPGGINVIRRRRRHR